MAALQAAARRDVRIRSEDDMEPATWKVVADAPDLAPEKPVRLRSVTSAEEAIIEFHNASALRVQAVWLDFSGNECSYTVLEPGTKRRYRTYVSHPWIIRAVDSGARMMLGDAMVVLGAADKETKVVINVPPALKWDLSTHKLFPNEFKATTRALLIAHHTLRHGSSVTPQASESLSTSASGCSLLVESLDVSKAQEFCSAAASTCCPSTLSSTVCSVPSSSPPSEMGADEDVDMNEQDNYYFPYSSFNIPDSSNLLHATLPTTPRSRNRAAKMLGWVVAKVVRVSKSPMRAPRPHAHMTKYRSPSSQALQQQLSQEPENPTLADHIAELPEHLILHILSFMAPDVHQCVSLGPGGYPDIKPAVLNSDPDTWPLPAAAPMELEGQQQNQNQNQQQNH